MEKHAEVPSMVSFPSSSDIPSMLQKTSMPLKGLPQTFLPNRNLHGPVCPGARLRSSTPSPLPFGHPISIIMAFFTAMADICRSGVCTVKAYEFLPQVIWPRADV